MLTLTVTAARRQHVHSRWQQQGRRRKSSSAASTHLQTDHQATEVVSGRHQSDPADYLYEVALTVEAVDLVVTRLLLDHVGQLVQPIHSIECLKSPPQTADATSGADPPPPPQLPLIFVSSKGLRLFLVDLDDDGASAFLLVNVDGAEVSPRVQNPLVRTGSGLLLKPDLYAEAEQSGQLFVPGRDVEDRQYQLDLTGISFSSGLPWKFNSTRIFVKQFPF